MFPHLPKLAKVFGFLGVQLFFALYVISIRPFEMIRDNLRESLNEIMLTFYTFFFIKHKEPDDWNDIVAWMYIIVATSNI
mmetsp:Transcript_5875/g.5035  ORF Transcript_5875/g.5035 Transcript_5875/m.5035 type:complete len:80 (+) Transcript_5875:152-391(+)